MSSKTGIEKLAEDFAKAQADYEDAKSNTSWAHARWQDALRREDETEAARNAAREALLEGAK